MVKCVQRRKVNFDVRTIAWKVAIFIVLTIAAYFCDEILRMGWNSALVYDRLFSTSIGINWPAVISASFDVLFFYAFGLLTTAALGGSRNIWWAVALGGVCSAIRFHFTRHFFYSGENWTRYVWTYGVYVVPPVAAYLGAITSRALNARRGSQRRLMG